MSYASKKEKGTMIGISSWESVPGTLTPKAKAKAQSLTVDTHGNYQGGSGCPQEVFK